MVVCPACGAMSRSLCASCRRSLLPAPIRLVSGTPVAGGYAHRGAAVSLVHRLKYRRDRSAAQLLIDRMATVVAHEPSVIVPIPRSWARRIRYGIDPGLVLARGLGATFGVPVLEAFRPPLWMARHTATERSMRRRRRFVLARPVPPDALLVDDVLTSGSTIAAAIAAAGPGRFSVATATTAGTME